MTYLQYIQVQFSYSYHLQLVTSLSSCRKSLCLNQSVFLCDYPKVDFMQAKP
ncbi:hypothetical protein HanRHA438_Chr07g0293891 [Helianthus annuus]|nr:hypothetical protein HanRHA438_Chr07g0293891 [Helianthus annuus]